MVDGKKKANGKRKTNAITKKLLEMTERPTTAGQERYGHVDVAGTQERYGHVRDAAAERRRRDRARRHRRH